MFGKFANQTSFGKKFWKNLFSLITFENLFVENFFQNFLRNTNQTRPESLTIMYKKKFNDFLLLNLKVGLLTEKPVSSGSDAAEGLKSDQMLVGQN